MTVWDRAVSVALGKKIDEIPVVLQVYSMVLKRFAGVNEYDYYQSSKLQLESKIAFQHRFPDVINIGIGAYPEYGEFIGPIPTAFGGKLRWMEDAPPYVMEYPIKNVIDVDRITEASLPDPDAGVANEILRRLEYFYFPSD